MGPTVPVRDKPKKTRHYLRVDRQHGPTSLERYGLIKLPGIRLTEDGREEARKPTSATIGAKVNAPRKGALRKAAIQGVLTIAQCHNEIGLSRGLPQNFSRHGQPPRDGY